MTSGIGRASAWLCEPGGSREDSGTRSDGSTLRAFQTPSALVRRYESAAVGYRTLWADKAEVPVNIPLIFVLPKQNYREFDVCSGGLLFEILYCALGRQTLHGYLGKLTIPCSTIIFVCE